VHKYSLQALPQHQFHWVKKRSGHVAGIHPWWLLAPLSERGGGGISAPGSPRKSPLSPPFPKGGIFASFRLINPENILFYLRLSAQIFGLNNFSKRSVV
jgi:hypothetical protein